MGHLSPEELRLVRTARSFGVLVFIGIFLFAAFMRSSLRSIPVYGWSLAGIMALFAVYEIWAAWRAPKSS
jgi:hypothetical protein